MSKTSCIPQDRRRSLLPAPKVVVGGSSSKVTHFNKTDVVFDKDSVTCGKTTSIAKTGLLNSKLLLPKKSGKTASITKESNNNCVSRVSNNETQTRQDLDTTNRTRCSVGSSCRIAGDKTGIVRYFGPVQFAQGEWCGVELNEPTGKHDGVVKGRRYFTCAEKHGVFVPFVKIETFSGTQSLIDKPTRHVVDVNENCSVRQRNLRQPRTSLAPELDKRKLPHVTTLSEKVGQKTTSKLLQPKVTGKSKQTRFKDKPEVSPNETIVLSSDCLSNVSPAKRHKAESLEASTVCQLNSTYDIAAHDHASNRSALGVSKPPEKCSQDPESDFLLDFTYNIMSNPDEKDILSTSHLSLASSLGILSDHELCDDNVLSTLPQISVANGEENRCEDLIKCSKWIENDLDEKDLDLEIAGIPTPEEEVSSQSSTGRGAHSSPELDATQTAGLTHTTLDLTFQLIPGQTSTPTSPFKVGDKDNVHIKPKLPTELKVRSEGKSRDLNTLALTEKTKALNVTYALKDGNANEVDQNEEDSPELCPKRMKTSSVIDQAGKRLNASFELAKTTVSQYADLVRGAERERLQSLRKREKRLSLIELRSSSLTPDDFSDQNLLRHSFHEDILRGRNVGPLEATDNINKLRKDYVKYVDTKSAHTEVPDSRKILDVNKVLQTGDTCCDQNVNRSGMFAVDISSKNLDSSSQELTGDDKKLLADGKFQNVSLGIHGQEDSEENKLNANKQKFVNEKPDKVQLSDNLLSSDPDVCQDSVDGRGETREAHVVIGSTSSMNSGLDPSERIVGEVPMESTCDGGMAGKQERHKRGERSHRPTSFVSTSSADTGYQPDTDSEGGGAATDPLSPTTSSDSATLKEDLVSTASSQLASPPDKTTEVYDEPLLADSQPELHTDKNVEDSTTTSKEEPTEIRPDLEAEPHSSMNCSETTDPASEAWNNNLVTEVAPDEEGIGSTQTVVLATDSEQAPDTHNNCTEGEMTEELNHDEPHGIASTKDEVMSQPEECAALEDKLFIGDLCGSHQHESGVAEEEPCPVNDDTVDDSSTHSSHCDEKIPLEADNGNEQSYKDIFSENKIHDENLQNYNEDMLVLPLEDIVVAGGEAAPAQSEGEDQHASLGLRGDAEDVQSVDTDTQKLEEMELLDMSWDNMMEFTQIKEKLVVGDFVAIEDVAMVNDGGGGGLVEVMDTECQDSSHSVDTSREECPELSAEVTAEQGAVKGVQKRKSKTGVRETKASRLRGTRDSPEKSLDKEASSPKTGSPKKTESKVPLASSSGMKKPLAVSQIKQVDSHKPKTAIAKSKSGISSHFKKPSALSTVTGGSDTQKPGELKLSKTETKSLQKRKTDSALSANPVPSKKAASSGKSGKHSGQSISQKADASSTSKHDLNVSNSSTEAKSRSFDRPPSGSKKTAPTTAKSRIISGEKKTTTAHESVSKSQPAKSKLQLPKSTGGKKTVTGKDKTNVTTSVNKTNLRRSTICTTTASAGRLPGGVQTGSHHTRLVTSTPKALGGQHSLDLSNITLLNTSQDSCGRGTAGPRAAKTLTGKPSHRTTMALKKRERSASVGSDSQTSVTSLVSTISNISRVSTQGSSHTRSKESPVDTSLVDGAGPSKPKRTGLKKREPPEPKKLGISVSTDGRLAAKSKSSQPLASSSPKKNQNRNIKPGSTPGKGSTTQLPSSKRSQQSTAGSQLVNREEVTRLEALCESRTKELNYARMQFKQSVAGFEAMSVLVKYLTEELGAFSLPEVCSQLQKKEQHLCETQSQLTELTVQRDALIEEIKCIQALCASNMEKLQEEHTAAFSALKEQNQEHCHHMSEKHEEETNSLKSSHEKQLLEVKKEHEVHLQEQERCHNQAVDKVQQDTQTKLAELTKQHEDALNDITMRFEDIKMTLSEKVEYLRGECEMLRKREKEHMETFQNDSDLKVQLAIKPFQQLPAEIDSLKAVLDMRNDEIHQLRRQKLELEKQLEDLPKAQEQIKALEYKTENLEAVISLRSNNEKSLAEKYQLLMRKLDRESKANKRLSMENEEFQWRMSQNDGDLMSRSISHSPTSSTASTPEPTRKRRSPLPSSSSSAQSPRSPRTSGTDFDKVTQRSPRSSGQDLDKKGRSLLRRSNGDLNSPRHHSYSSDYDRVISPRSSTQDSSLMSVSMHSEPSYSSSPPCAGAAGLKRSGTYELLDQEFENAELSSTTSSPREHVKQTDV